MLTDTTKSGGIGFGGLLLIVFITLKLTGYITWSWGWVFAPVWIPLGIVLGGFLSVVIIAAIVRIFSR